MSILSGHPGQGLPGTANAVAVARPPAQYVTIDLTQENGEHAVRNPARPTSQDEIEVLDGADEPATIDLTADEGAPVAASGQAAAPPTAPTGVKRSLPDSFLGRPGKLVRTNGQGWKSFAASHRPNGQSSTAARPFLSQGPGISRKLTGQAPTSQAVASSSGRPAGTGPTPSSSHGAAPPNNELAANGEVAQVPQAGRRFLPARLAEPKSHPAPQYQPTARTFPGFGLGAAQPQGQRLQWLGRRDVPGPSSQASALAAPVAPAPVPYVAPVPAPQGVKRVTPTSLLLSKELLQSSVAVVDHQAAMRAVLENLALTGDDEIDPPQKSLMISIMRHQRMALAWMVKREMGSTPQGGILADDQGLGKTISTISLIVTNMPDPMTRGQGKRAAGQGSMQLDSEPASGPSSRSATPEGGGDEQLLPGGTLVVCPTTVLHQWYRELSEKVNRQAMNFTVHIYHGKDKATSAVQLSRYSVVLTTYGTLAMEVPASVRNNAKGKKNQGAAGATNGNGDASARGPADGASSDDERGSGSVKKEENGYQVPKEGIVKQEVCIKPEIKSEIKAEPGLEGTFELSGSLSYSADASAEPAVTSRSRPPAAMPEARLSAGGSGTITGGKRRSTSAAPDDSGGLLFQIGWHRVVLDEAQCIKNPRTLVAHAAWRLSADHRWCLSGTPIQNSVDDLFSYFKFLRYAPYDNASSFKSLLKDKIVNNPEAGFKLLSVVLQAILLRRTKQSKIGGEPIVNLPPRQQELEQREFSTKAEQEFYARVQQESVASVEAATQAGGAQQYVHMLYSLLKLRQACNHPWLVKGSQAHYGGKSGAGNGTAPATVKPASAVQVAAARKLGMEDRRRLLELVLHPAAQCPSCQDVPEQGVVTRCGHVYCSDCISTQMEGTGQPDEFICSTCSAVVQSTQIFTASALQAAQGTAPTGQDKQPPTAEWVSSTKVDRLLQLLSEVRQRNIGDTAASSSTQATLSNVLAVRSKADKALARTFKSLGPSAPSARGPGAASGPLLKDGRRPEKVIVFSQWTGMLDLLELALRHGGYVYRRLDGAMAVPTRERAITDFEQKAEVNILIVSLKAAALGLNLTVANHVVLMDLWWNPTTEEQAIDRAHRIGQKRTVFVTRITIKGTVEERILELQERKRQIVAAALEGGNSAAANKLSMEDLRFLFMGGGGSSTASAGSRAPQVASTAGAGVGGTVVTTEARQVHSGTPLTGL